MTSRQKDPGLFWGILAGLIVLLLCSTAGAALAISKNIRTEERKACLVAGQTWDDIDSFCYTPGGSE